MRVFQKVLRLTQILDLLYTFNICMGITSTDIGFSSFIRSGSVFPQQKCASSFRMTPKNFLNDPCIRKLLLINKNNI